MRLRCASDRYSGYGIGKKQKGDSSGHFQEESKKQCQHRHGCELGLSGSVRAEVHDNVIGKIGAIAHKTEKPTDSEDARECFDRREKVVH